MNYNQYISLNYKAKFHYFMKTRFPTNKTPRYWIKWSNVLKNIKPYEISLNTLNYLVHSKDIKLRAKKLFKEQPQLLKAIPILLASRDLDINILNIDNNDLSYYKLDFAHPNLSKLNDYLKFINDSGLFNFLQNYINQSLVDYVYGVEAGLDTNGRKNRSGTQNEIILNSYMTNLSNKYPYLKSMPQPTAKKIFNKWHYKIPKLSRPSGKGGRRYDGAILNTRTNIITLIETNFYNNGGSKLKSVAGEFRDIYINHIKKHTNINYVWISDGPGWSSAKNPMEEAFEVIPNIFNLNMIKNHYLLDLIK